MPLLALLFADPGLRKQPRKVIGALSDSGIPVSTLCLMFLAVSIIGVCLQFTGRPMYISLDVLGWLKALNLGAGGSVMLQTAAPLPPCSSQSCSVWECLLRRLTSMSLC